MRLSAPLRPYFPYLKPAYTVATALVAPATKLLSRAKGGYLPTGAVATLEDAASSSGGHCVTVRAEERVDWPRATGIPADAATFAAVPGAVIKRQAVAVLPHGRAIGSYPAIVTRNGDLVQDVSYYFGTNPQRPSQHPLFLHPNLPAPHHVSGRVGVLATRGDSNYFHFLVDVLPRLSLVTGATGIAVPDRWYVSTQKVWQRELLELAGVPLDSCIDAADVPHLSADELVVPSPVVRPVTPAWIVPWLRGILLGAETPRRSGRRVLLTRDEGRNNRRIVNFEDVRAELERRGFELFDPGAHTVREQIAMFAESEIIVGPHGAGLANLVFASPGSSLVELFPGGRVLPDAYRQLAQVTPGLNYRYLVSGTGSRLAKFEPALVSDIDVDIPGLLQLLDDLAAQR
jgi:capsular polysaccharide biosynthesis protein